MRAVAALHQAAVLEALPYAAAYLTLQKSKACEHESDLVKPPILDDEQLRAYMLQRFGMRIPDVQVCPNHSTPWRAFADAFFARSPVALWKASRGLGGKSHLLAALGLAEATALKADVKILGGSGEQAKRVHESMQRFWWHPLAPRDLLASDPTQKVTTLTGGNQIEALLASQKSVRGPHPQRLRIDEADECDWAILEAARGQPQDARGILSQLVMSSTHQYEDGPMTTLLEEAEQQGWPVHEWCLGYETPISTPLGDRPIGSLAKGDAVYGFDEKTGRAVPVRLSDAWCSGTKPTITIHLSTGSLACTQDHQFLTRDRGWQKASNLRPGDILPCLRPNGQDGKDTLPMRRAETAQVQEVSPVLQARDGREEHPGHEHAHAGPGNREAREWNSFAAGGDGGRVDGSDGHRLRDEDPVGPVCLRLQDDSAPRDRGGLRPLAQHDQGPGEGRSKAACCTVAGNETGRSLVHGSALVVEISPGSDLAVYDITVPGFHAFIAAGVIAHNCYRETMAGANGWVTEEIKDRKRAIMSAEAWRIEVELQRPNAEAKAISPEAVERMFRRDLGVFKGENGEYIEIETPQSAADYAHGADWGRRRDWAIVWTFRTDVFPARLVAFERRGRTDWPELTALLDSRQRRFSGRARHDGTGLGDVVDHFLQVPAEGIWIAGKVRQELFSGYVLAIENGLFEAPMIEWAYKEHRRCTRDDLYGAGHPPDTIVAGALAASLFTTGSVPLTPESIYVGGNGGNGHKRRATVEDDGYHAMEEELAPWEA